MAKTVDGQTTEFTWDLNTPSGTPQLLVGGSTDYIFGPDGLPLEQVSGTSVEYDLHDQLGSTRLVTDSSGNVVGTFTDSAYCILVGETGTATAPFGFAGGYTDAESGLQYLINRYYDPGTGQFTSVDLLVGLTGRPYAYTGNPVNQTDPTGLGTEGYCFAAHPTVARLSGTVQGCLVKTNSASQVGVTFTYGGTLDAATSNAIEALVQLAHKNPIDFLKQLVGVSAVGEWQTSNATELTQLCGKFRYTAESAGLLWGGGYETFAGSGGVHGQDWSVGRITGFNLSLSGTTNTLLTEFTTGSKPADLVSGLIDSLNAGNPLSWYNGFDWNPLSWNWSPFGSGFWHP